MQKMTTRAQGSLSLQHPKWISQMNHTAELADSHATSHLVVTVFPADHLVRSAQDVVVFPLNKGAHQVLIAVLD